MAVQWAQPSPRLAHSPQSPQSPLPLGPLLSGGALAELQRTIAERVSALAHAAEALWVQTDELCAASSTAPTIIDISRVELRSKHIEAMKSLNRSLQAIMEKIHKHSAAAEQLHKAEVNAIQQSLYQAVQPDPPSPPSPPAPPSESGANWPAPACMRQPPGGDYSLQQNCWQLNTVGRSVASLLANSAAAPPPHPLGQLGSPAVSRSAAPTFGATRANTPDLFASKPRGATPTPVGVIVGGEAGSQFTLEAVVITASDKAEIMAAIAGPQLYFVARWNHFAVRIGKSVFHANLGKIYRRGAFVKRRPTINDTPGMHARGEYSADTRRPRSGPPSGPEGKNVNAWQPESDNDARSAAPDKPHPGRLAWQTDAPTWFKPGQQLKPERVKGCNRVACDMQTCRFYHDPALHPGSRDVRNYMAESFAYTPFVDGNIWARRFGSNENLDADLRLIGAGDARLFRDQVAHDILCALILDKYFGHGRE